MLRGYPVDANLPPLPDQLRAGSGLAGIDSQAALFELSSRFLATVAARRPLVLCLEDLHWSDAASLDLVRHIARTLTDQPILLLATYRTTNSNQGTRSRRCCPRWCVRGARSACLSGGWTTRPC